MDEAEDRRLVERSRAGDLRAFDEIVLRYQRPLFNVALRMLNNYEDAVDVTQTSFLKAFEQLGSYDPDRKFFSWLYRIQMNEALNWIKRRKPNEDIPEDLRSFTPNPEEEYLSSEIAASVQRAIAELPLGLRQVIVLRHIAGLSYQDIAEVLATPAKTVKSRLFEARHKLRDILARHGAVSA